MINNLLSIFEKSDYIKEVLELTTKLVNAVSLSSKERNVADILKRKMEEYNLDEVMIDDFGNVIGKIIGGCGKSVMFNGHIDCVDVGSMEDPYSGKKIGRAHV